MAEDLSDEEIALYPRDPLPGGAWPELDAARQRAEAMGLTLKAVLLGNEEASRQVLVKRVHDVRGALRTLRYVVEALETGYKFDDARAGAKVEAIRRAVQSLETETQLLIALLSP